MKDILDPSAIEEDLEKAFSIHSLSEATANIVKDFIRNLYNDSVAETIKEKLLGSFDESAQEKAVIAIANLYQRAVSELEKAKKASSEVERAEKSKQKVKNEVCQSEVCQNKLICQSDGCQINKIFGETKKVVAASKKSRHCFEILSETFDKILQRLGLERSFESIESAEIFLDILGKHLSAHGDLVE